MMRSSSIVGTTSSMPSSKPTDCVPSTVSTARAWNDGRRPALAAMEEPPGALHLEVRVHRPVADPMEQVLAPRHDLAHHLALEVDGGEGGHPEVRRGEHPAGEGVVLLPRRPVDGVTLGHF